MKDKNKKSAKKLQKEEEIMKKKRKKRRRSKNKEYTIISYFFVAIFISLIGYMVYFNVVEREDVISSPYNTRQNQLADRITEEKFYLQTDRRLLIQRQMQRETKREFILMEISLPM